MNADDCPACFYCRMPLGGFHEHDHAPVPRSRSADLSGRIYLAKAFAIGMDNNSKEAA